jgi:hypothetical protein
LYLIFYQILLTLSQVEFVHKNIGHRNVLRFSKEKATKQFFGDNKNGDKIDQK